MQIPLIVILLLVVLLISGCTTGTMYYADSGKPVKMLEGAPEPEINHSEPEIPDPCANVDCPDSTFVCPDGFEARCQNICEQGECTNCTPDCTEHQDPCANITCNMSRLECPDGALAACRNTCNPETGLCTNCTPDCTGHEVCQTHWVCTEWSICLDGKQSRNCTDENKCGTVRDKPPENQECEVNRTEHIVFSEIYYDTAGTEYEEEWIELYNPTNSLIILNGWKISDNTKSWNIPNGTAIGPEGYVIISRNSTAFYNLYGCYPDLENLTLSLSNSGDYLTLWDNEGTAVDFVAWESPENYTDWDIVALENNTIKRLPPEQDSDSPSDWFSNQTPEPAC